MRIAWPGELKSLPVGQRGGMQPHGGIFGKVRRAEQVALEVVGPAMQRADDVFRIAAAFEHDRLAVPADVREQFDPARGRSVAHQYLRVVGPFEAAEIARVRHHQFVAHIVGPGVEQQLLLEGEDFRV